MRTRHKALPFVTLGVRNMSQPPIAGPHIAGRIYSRRPESELSAMLLSFYVAAHDQALAKTSEAEVFVSDAFTLVS
jgi:hypothetical protein